MADETVKSGELVDQKKVTTEMVPAFMDQNNRDGLEDIGADEIKLPRLGIAQGLSPQMDESSSAYIKELKVNDMFNDLSGEIYGRGPLTFLPVLRGVRFIEFDPDNRGTVLDMNVPPTDPRTQWTTDEEGKRVPPRATKFVEFVGLLVHENREPEIIVLSIKDTNKFNRRAHDRLTMFIKMSNRAIYSAMYEITSKPEKNDSGTFGVFIINKKGLVQDQELYENARGYHHALKGKTIVVNREATPEDDAAGSGEGGDTSFDTSGM